MAGPARAGLFIYAKNLANLAGFYEKLLGLARVRSTDELVILSSPELQIIVHAMPALVARETSITSPPAIRDNAASKFFYTVPSLPDAQAVANSLGGQVLPEQWRGLGFIVRNAVDPEGNIFQLREGAP
ncbi:putative enzyme related to lactoylglutathione lyase [Xanthomonas arboricola]|uniref:glyoxalase/bleomycin resistance/dioxygenase family protein n=1 Tax=Xanthomonas sp. 3793 TaxID=3035312 RepID=UPI002166CB92|nr:glyoxalase/bleomycin resistance/dioxygenase family protein [Xanthomonas sp. 3793]MCS3747136.1 putative enzyme related to lactoylglutathione lyase [Xanthomonas sp. 3793]